MANVYTTVDKMLRDQAKVALLAAYTALASEQIVVGFANTSLQARHIRVLTPQSEPEVIGGANRGRWNVQLELAAVSSLDDDSETVHDTICERLSVFVLASDLATRLTTATLGVDEIVPQLKQDTTYEGLRITTYQLNVMCRRIPA